MRRVLPTVLLALSLLACAAAGGAEKADPAPDAIPEGLAVATFAGGCFWCMEPPFEKLDGVEAVISGYTGGAKENPSYQEVSAGVTGHAEAVQVHYDPERVRYPFLLQVFWRQIDPTDGGGQFVDRGTQYRPEIFYHDEAQREAAERSRAELEESGRFSRPIFTAVTRFQRFYPAEEYHQDFYKKSPRRYYGYRAGSGRDAFLEKVWGDDLEIERPKISSAPHDEGSRKPPDEELRARLTPLQYHVTQEEGTERPFDNQYWDNKEEGIYVDVVSGEPLFSSRDKFRSGTGWPSFTRPLAEESITSHTDHRLLLPRTEVRSRRADSHLGHVFKDGPPPTGLRYCVNSAALRFIPRADLEAEGYGELAALFED